MDEKISFDEFKKLDLKIGKIVNVKEHPDAEKLFVLEIDFGGEKRTIVAGLRQHYKKEELKGKKGVFIVNLEPVRLRGIESNGMLLAAVSDDRKKVQMLIPDKDIEEGTKVS